MPLSIWILGNLVLLHCIAKIIFQWRYQVKVGQRDRVTLFDGQNCDDGVVYQVGGVRQPGKRFEAFPTEKLIDPTWNKSKKGFYYVKIFNILFALYWQRRLWEASNSGNWYCKDKHGHAWQQRGYWRKFWPPNLVRSPPPMAFFLLLTSNSSCMTYWTRMLIYLRNLCSKQRQPSQEPDPKQVCEIRHRCSWPLWSGEYHCKRLANWDRRWPDNRERMLQSKW